MSTKTFPRISETEWEVMRAVWAKHPATANEIIERLARVDPSWHPKTAKTLLARLVRKRALDYEPQGRSYVYEPLVSEHECVAAASASFLDRVFGGSLKPLLAHFIESSRLTKQELKELEQLLEQGAGSRMENKKEKKGGQR
jgi:BlaI family transcriptional regulator, penicillinase repressor